MDQRECSIVALSTHFKNVPFFTSLEVSPFFFCNQLLPVLRAAAAAEPCEAARPSG